MSLYLEHFGLREPPFRITPHTDFFFTGANRGPTLEALIYAITQDEGIVKVTGEVGSGKTMLCRMLLERLPDNVETLYLANPSLSRQEILGAIADELGVPTDGKATHSLTRALQDALIDRYAAGKRVVILIDEAHAMPAESLEEIRLLSNLESKATKLLQIALFAQPELNERLTATDMRQLRERITQHFQLAPLRLQDVASYIEFRLRAADYRGPNPFSDGAIEKIARISEGLSRRINILADKALLAAYARGEYKVDVAQIMIAEQDAHFSPIKPKAPANRQPLYWAIGGGALASLIFGATLFLTARYEIKVIQPATENPAPTPQPSPIPAAASTPKHPLAENPGISNGMTAPAPPHASPATEKDKLRFGPLTEQHFTQYEQWIGEAPRAHYFIQLLAADATQTVEIEAFLNKASQILDPSTLRAYRSSLSGHDRVGVIYGEYSNRTEATLALRSLPEPIRTAQPFPRQVIKLQE